jgi:hypothetical protein
VNHFRLGTEVVFFWEESGVKYSNGTRSRICSVVCRLEIAVKMASRRLWVDEPTPRLYLKSLIQTI